MFLENLIAFEVIKKLSAFCGTGRFFGATTLGFYPESRPFFFFFFFFLLKINFNVIWGHAVAQWLRHYATNRKVAGSIPDEVIFLNLPDSSGHTRPWGLLSL
jgi:hypothetical protein